jgi:hypothetical protein
MELSAFCIDRRVAHSATYDELHSVIGRAQIKSPLLTKKGYSMKALSIFIVLVVLVSSITFAQQTPVDVLYLKNGSIIRGQLVEMSGGSVKIKTADGSLFVYSMSEVEKMVKDSATIPAAAPVVAPDAAPTVAPVAVPVQKTTRVKRVQEAPVVAAEPQIQPGSFGMRGAVFVGLQNWSKLKISSGDSRLGFGFMGTIVGGVNLDLGMYVGAGPQFGGSFWTLSKTIAGQTASATTSVMDYGINVVFGIDDMFALVGFGGADVGMSATAGGHTETVDMPEAGSYSRLGFGWGDGFGLGIFLVSYGAPYQNLGRFEICLGFAF